MSSGTLDLANLLEAGGPDAVLAALTARHRKCRDATQAAFDGTVALVAAQNWDALERLHARATAGQSAFRGIFAYGEALAAARRFDLAATVALSRQAALFAAQALHGPLQHEQAVLAPLLHRMVVQALLMEPEGYGESDGLPVGVPVLPPGGGPLVMACADETYFQAYGPRFLASLNTALPGARWLIHIINPCAEGESLRQDLLARYPNGAIGTEHAAPDATYYASRRFMLCGAVHRQGCSVLVCDMDSIFPADLPAILDRAGAAGLAYVRPDKWGLAPQLMISGAFLFLAAGSRIAADFCRHVETYLRAKVNEGQSLWTMDQAALFRGLCLLGEASRADTRDLSADDPAILSSFAAPHLIGQDVRRSAPSRSLHFNNLSFGPDLRPIVTLE